MADTTETPGAGGTSSEVDGTLVRILDGELLGSTENESRALLESSPEARLRLEELRGSSDLFSDSLAKLPIPRTPDPHFLVRSGVSAPVPAAEAPRVRGESTIVRHRIAAGIVLLLVSIGLISPVRAWIVEGARSLVSVLAPGERPTDPVTEVEVGSSTVSFVPVGNEFLVSVEAYQVSGRLTVVVVEGSRASGEILGEATGIDLLVLPDGFEVRNGPGSVAGYTVGIPQSLERLRVQVGGRDLGIRTLGGTEVGHSWVFELSDPHG